MTCGNCGAQNREGRKFCGECGTPLSQPCPACGAANERGELYREMPIVIQVSGSNVSDGMSRP